ncbi:MAG: hypothetical protein ACSLFN_16305 [Candidatus Limnocylindrales bacterium]
MTVTGTGLKVSENRVTLSVLELTPTHEELLRERYGEAVVLRERAPGRLDCASEHNCRPMKGGLHIESSIDEAVDCTGGFIVRRELNGGQLAMLTAGHCLEIAREPDEDQVNDDWQHNNDPFGDAKYETWLSNAGADVGLIGLHSTEVSAMSVYNQLALKSNNSSPVVIRNVTDVLHSSFQNEGTLICRYGITTDSVCAEIIEQGETLPSCKYLMTGCKPIQGLWVYDMDSRGGDSGGPVYIVASSTARVALGTHVHSSDEVNTSPPYSSWYSPIDRAQTTYDSMFNDWFTVCTDSNC